MYRLLQDDMKRGTRGGEEVMSEGLSSAGMWEGGNKPAADEALAGAGGKRTRAASTLKIMVPKWYRKSLPTRNQIKN